jgi:hypothetical protein
MDTFKDKQQLEGLSATGAAPWEVWKTKDAVGHQENLESSRASK